MPARRTRNVSVTPELDRFVADQLASGRYQTASEVVRAALRLLQERADGRDDRRGGRRRRGGAADPGAAPTPEFLAGGGEMGALARKLDWSATPLGAPAFWPQSLRVAVRLLLTTNHPMFIWWGPELVQLYNDAYRQTMGPERHPSALGQGGRACWAEIWGIIGPQIEAVMAGAGATWHEDQLVPVTRDGFLQEVYWTYSYGPIDDGPRVGGVLVVCNDTTRRVLAERRLKLLRDLAGALADADTVEGVRRRAVEVLGGYAEDLPFHELHLAPRAEPGECSGGEAEIPTAGALDDAVAAVAAGAPATLIELTGSSLARPPGAPWPEPVRSALVLPVAAGESAVAGVLVAGISPRLPLDEAYRELLARVAAQIGVALRSQAEASARRRADEALRVSEDRLQTALEASGLVGAWDWDVASDLVHSDARFARLYGVDPARAAAGAPLAEFLAGVHPDDRRRVAAATRRAVETAGELAEEYRLVQRDGSVRWVLARGRCFRAEGGARRFPGVTVDITQRKQVEEERELLVAELSHRVKNTLAIVLSIARQTWRHAATPAAAGEALDDRLMALARAHDVLTREAWAGASLREVVERAIEPYRGDDRFTVEGAEVRLPPGMALTLALAFQELATNAVKHGALSVPGSGRVGIQWRVDDATAPPRLRLRWEEAGGPPVAPPMRRGFGSVLIERGLAQNLNGRVRLAFEPAGVLCEVDAPLDRPAPADGETGFGDAPAPADKAARAAEASR